MNFITYQQTATKAVMNFIFLAPQTFHMKGIPYFIVKLRSDSHNEDCSILLLE